MSDRHQLNPVVIFGEALDLDDSDVDSFVHEACAGDESIEREVRALLESHRVVQQSTFLRSPDGRVGERLGPYRILAQIGEGGMGTVYLAEQTKPVHRRVAIKVLRDDLGSRQAAARFEAEREALALMDHPNVARVLNAGTADDGHPYFVMELLQGVPITRFCDDHTLGINERLGLFISVCRGVHHAHQKGVIHRDLKPSNVLVVTHDDVATPKVIDFGVAKALARPLTEGTIVTEFGQLIGTPGYMSPEQTGLDGVSVDARTDIYSLGALLYELLTGETALDRETLRQATPLDLQRLICSSDPPRPSVRVGQDAEARESARARGVDPLSLRRRLRGDLDWIVLRALERDRTRRYPSVSELAGDIERHLRHEPVQAGPPSLTYRLGKALRRNTGTVGVGVGVLVIMLVAIGMEVSSQRTARRAAEQFGKKQAEIAEDLRVAVDTNDAILEFLDADLFGAVNPDVEGPDVLVWTVLEEAAARVSNEFADRPLVAAQIHGFIGRAFTSLSEFERADRQFARAFELCREFADPDDPITLDAQHDRAALMIRQDKHAVAIGLLKDLCERRLRAHGLEHKKTLMAHNNLALCYKATGEHDLALGLYEMALEPQHRLFGERDSDTLLLRNNIASLRYRMGMSKEGDDARECFEKAATQHRQILATLITTSGESHSTTITSMANLGGTLVELGELEEAHPLLDRAVTLGRTHLGSEHFRTTAALRYLGKCLLRMQRWEEAERALLEAHATSIDTLGPQHTRVGEIGDLLRELYVSWGEPEKAAEWPPSRD